MLTDERIDRIGHAFRRLTDRRAQGLWCAPGRVNLLGEHTDYNDGLVLPFAIERETLAAVALRDDDELRCWSRQDDGTDWHAYVHGVRAALREAGVVVPGAEVVVESDVPVGGGLSSSAALTVSIATALHDLVGGTLDRYALAEVCRQAESAAGAHPGLMDPVASLFAEPGSLVYFDTRSGLVEPVVADFGGLSLLVVDTGVRHSTAAAGYATRRQECRAAAELFGVDSLRDLDLLMIADHANRPESDQLLVRRARHVLMENVRVKGAVAFLRTGRARDVGALMHASHVSLRDDFEASSPELDVTVDAVMQAGAVGARLTGAGFGGCVILLMEPEREDAIRQAVAAAYAGQDWAPPGIFAAVPSAGARRLR